MSFVASLMAQGLGSEPRVAQVYGNVIMSHARNPPWCGYLTVVDAASAVSLADSLA